MADQAEIPQLPGPNDNNNGQPPRGYIRQQGPETVLDYDGAFPEEPLPPAERRRRTTVKIPIGFNYAPEQAADYTLKSLVSSRKARDIVRSANFMPGQFDVWNAKPNGGNNRYTGQYEDLDGDDINEYVVKRDNQIVAVNGYTTKASDFPFRAEYWQSHPTEEQRKAEPYRDYLTNTYYSPTYNDDYSEITRWNGIDPTSAEFRRKYKNHVTHAPTKFSPYRAFSQFIVAPAMKAFFLAIGDNNAEKAKVARKVLIDMTGKKAIEASYASIFYDNTIKIPFLNSIANQLEALRGEFIAMKQRSDPEFQEDWRDGSECSKKFDQWLFNKAEVKSRIHTYVHNMLTTQKRQRINEVRDKLLASWGQREDYVTTVNQLWAQKVAAAQAAYQIGE